MKQLTQKITYGAYLITALLAFAGVDLVDRQDTAVATNLGLFGGSPQDITVDPNDDGVYVYVATYTPNGIFSSDDAGDNWTAITNEVDYGAGKAVVVDSDTGDVYALIGDNVIKSTNHGEDWSKLTANLVGNPIVGSAAVFANGTFIYSVSEGGVQISTDGGDTFSEVVVNGETDNSTDVTIASLAADSVGNFYAIVQDDDADTSQLYMSNDAGSSWVDMDVEAAGVTAGSRFYGVSVDPLDDDHLVLASYHPDYDSQQTFDAGATWTVLDDDGDQVGAEEAVFDGVGGLYVGTRYTSDASVENPTWTEIETSTPLSTVRGDLYAVDAVHPTTVYSNSGLGVAKSEDGGASWVDQVDGMTALQTFAISQAENKDVVWIGANGGLARSTNFTDTQPDWDFPIMPESGLSSVQAVWVKPDNTDIVVAGLVDYISRSTDGGDTWEHADAPAFNGTVAAMIQSPRNNRVLYALYTNTSLTEDDYDGGVLKSTDAGASWSELDFPTTLADGALGLAVRNDEDVLYVGIGNGGSETGVYTYSNGDWEALEEDFNGLYVNNILVHPDDANIVFVSLEADSTEGSLYKSVDAGATWTTITDGLATANHLGAMAVQGDGTMYLAGQASGNPGMIYKSTDVGESWSDYYVGKRQEFFYTLLFDGLVTGNDRGLFNLKTLGKVQLQARALDNHVYRMTTTLKDAATLQRLANKRILIYKKRAGASWRLVETAHTNNRGIYRFRVTARSGDKVKVVWKPKRTDRAEYARSVSRVLTAD